MRRALLIALASIGLMAAEPAAQPDQPLASPAQEARAQALFEIVRCVVCQHESIADSPAGIAGDMRMLVREQIAGGATDEQVEADLIRRYGDYVLFRPPLGLTTLGLWFGPFLLVLLGGCGLFWMMRRKPAVTAPLSDDEEARLALLMLPPNPLQTDNLRRETDAEPPHDGH